MLDQVEGSVVSFVRDGAHDQEHVYRTAISRDPDVEVIVPPRATVVLSETAETAPTQRDRHFRCIAERGRIGWKKAPGYNKRCGAETAFGRYKHVTGYWQRTNKDWRRAPEAFVTVPVLNQTQELGDPISVQIR